MKNSKWAFFLLLGMLYCFSSCEDEFDYIDPNTDPNLVDSTEIIIDPPVDTTWVNPNDPNTPIDSSGVNDPWFPIDSTEIENPNDPTYPGDSTWIDPNYPIDSTGIDPNDPWIPIDSTWVDPNTPDPADTTNLGG